MKNNIHKKETYQDNFSKKYACWVKNNRRAWRRLKRKVKKMFRALCKKDTSAQQ